MKVHVRLLVFSAILLVTTQLNTAIADINPMKLGATYNADRSAINFSVYSANAERIDLYLYNNSYGADDVSNFSLHQSGNGVWEAVVPVADLKAKGITGTVFYGYRAWGPNWPYVENWTKGSTAGFKSDVDANGNRFNPNKLLYDPYSLEISHDPLNPNNSDAGQFASGASNRAVDSGPVAPKGIVLQPVTGNIGVKPLRAQKDDIIYEVNVRGLTKQDPGIPEAYRGTYKGASLKASYLSSLGITAIELLPVQESQNQANNVIPNSNAGQNYWGYATEAYFAPDRYYAFDQSPGGPTAEFQNMVKSFHDAGIKVYIDVVYNHTGEGGNWQRSNGSTDSATASLLSWRGLDNQTYYELTADKQYYYDNTGTGGNYNTYQPVAQNLIVDSLSHWANTLGIDGFRFDLASVLGNSCLNGAYQATAPNCPFGGYNFNAADPNVAINRILRELTIRPAAGGNGVDLFAEPWAIGGNSYQVGGFPVGWSEWNGDFRDTMRRAQNKLGMDSVPLGRLTSVWAGSSGHFQWNRQPWNSTNFIDVHDGLTLKDVYSCNGANNSQAWPWGPSDGGTSNNLSWDQGSNPSDQLRAARTGMGFILLSAGTPLIQGGDEFLRTIQCNNNAYNLDSPGNWLNYELSGDQVNFQNFTRRAIAFRKAHPVLSPATWGDENVISWWQPNGASVSGNYWVDSSNHSIAYTLNGRASGDKNALYIAYNGWSQNVNFVLPKPPTGKQWYRVSDTCNWNNGPDTWANPGNEQLLGSAGYQYGLCGQALLVLISK